MRKFGKRNEVKVDPLMYPMCLLGAAGIGKTTIIKQYCEKLAGEDGYMFLEMAGEQGQVAINGLVYEDCDEWGQVIDIVEDIEDNKSTDYKDLRVIVIDTYDGWIQLAEQESIRLYNATNPENRAKSIDAAWGGFQRGQAKAFELMFDVITRLRKVGVSTIVIGHVKNKENTDPVSGVTYTTLTSDVENKYFNLLKKKMAFIALAYLDRTIKTEKTGKKNLVTHKDETINRLTSEERKISFRSDNFVIDSKSRFADIVDEIPFDCDELIKAISDAIRKEIEKTGKSMEQVAKEQEAEAEVREQEIAKAEEERKEQKSFDDKMEKIKTFIKENVKNNMDAVREIAKMTKKMGYENPTLITKPEDAEAVLAYIESL